MKDSRIRRARVEAFTAELDLSTRVVTVSWQPGGKAAMVLGEGTWNPLPDPMGDLRGNIESDSIRRETCTSFEYHLARANRTWSYEHGPWVTAAHAATSAGVPAAEAQLMQKLMWLFYRNRWPLRFTSGCGWGPHGHAPLIATALADPVHARARWELLILTGALQQPRATGDLDRVAGDRVGDDFYGAP